MASTTGLNMPNTSPSALPLPQTPAPPGPISPHGHASNPNQGFAPAPQMHTYNASNLNSPMAMPTPSYTPTSPPQNNMGPSMVPMQNPASPAPMPMPTATSTPSYAPAVSADHQRQIAELNVGRPFAGLHLPSAHASFRTAPSRRKRSRCCSRHSSMNPTSSSRSSCPSRASLSSHLRCGDPHLNCSSHPPDLHRAAEEVRGRDQAA